MKKRRPWSKSSRAFPSSWLSYQKVEDEFERVGPRLRQASYDFFDQAVLCLHLLFSLPLNFCLTSGSASCMIGGRTRSVSRQAPRPGPACLGRFNHTRKVGHPQAPCIGILNRFWTLLRPHLNKKEARMWN